MVDIQCMTVELSDFMFVFFLIICYICLNYTILDFIPGTRLKQIFCVNLSVQDRKPLLTKSLIKKLHIKPWTNNIKCQGLTSSTSIHMSLKQSLEGGHSKALVI